MNELRCGLSGCGPRGAAALAAAALQHHCRFVAVHDDRPGLADRLGADHGLSVAPSFDALLATGIDFVVLAGPLAGRPAQVTAAAEQAVPILLHAPMAADLAAGRHLVAAAAGHGVRLGVAVPWQADPTAEQLRRMVANGWTGALVAIDVQMGEPDLHLTPDRIDGPDLFATLGPAALQIQAWLTARRPLSVTAQRGPAFGGAIDAAVAATLLLRGGALFTLLLSRQLRAASLTLRGTDGSFRLGEGGLWLRGERTFHGPVFDYDAPGTDAHHDAGSFATSLADHATGNELHGRFARWLEDRDDFPCTGDDALRDLEVVDALQRATATGRAVEL